MSVAPYPSPAWLRPHPAYNHITTHTHTCSTLLPKPAGSDDIRLPPNECGALFSIDLDESSSGYRARTLVTGGQQMATGSGARCSPNNIADPGALLHAAVCRLQSRTIATTSVVTPCMRQLISAR